MRKIEIVLAEMLAALDGIEEATGGLALTDFEQSWVLRHAVQRGIEIISEASRHLPDELLVSQPSIPWRQIRTIGNFLRHAYHRIADVVVWSVVMDDLPPLKAALNAIRESVAKN